MTPLTNEQINADLELAAKASNLPWIVERGKFSGQNWLVATCGMARDGEYRAVTTDCVRVSERNGSDAGTDSDYISRACTALPDYAREVLRLRKIIDATAEDLHVKVGDLFVSTHSDGRGFIDTDGCGKSFEYHPTIWDAIAAAERSQNAR